MKQSKLDPRKRKKGGWEEALEMEEWGLEVPEGLDPCEGLEVSSPTAAGRF